MGKTKCINRSLKDFRDLKTRVSNALGLIDVTITDESLLDVIDLFAVEHNIAQEQVLDRMTDLSKYIEDYFGLNRKYEPVSEESKKLYNEWFNDNIEYINTPYTPNAKTKAFENDARIVTEENAKVVNLSTGQRMTVIPVFDMSSIYKEMMGIKNKAVADGTFGKVFNKKLKKWVNSNLNPNMWIHVRTKAFKNWFGDWENDPDNASKIVDENGEPLVVYHGTISEFNTFDTTKGAIYHHSDKASAKTYTKIGVPFESDTMAYESYLEGKALEEEGIYEKFLNQGYLKEEATRLTKEELKRRYPSFIISNFLNIRNPKIIEAGGSSWNSLQLSDLWEEEVKKLTASDYVQNEYSKWSKEDIQSYLDHGITEDGIKEIIAQSLLSDREYTTRDAESFYKESNYDGIIFKNILDIAHDSGGFGDVYVAYSANQVKSADENIGTYSLEDNNIYYNVSPITVEKTLTNNGLIHRYNNDLFVTRKENKNTQQLKEDIYKELERYGYSKESVSFKNKNNSILVTITEPQRKKDYVETEVNKAMSSIRETLEFLTEKIPALKGKVHYNITVEEATKILRRAGKTYHDGINSFVHNGNIYLIQGKVTQDIAIEEALHILTESLIADNRALASEMLHEAQKLFPQLVEDIRRTYKGKDTQNREILTQSLARVFRQEFNEGERQTAESILSKFVNWIKQLFGINTVTGNTIIELDQLSTDMTLRDFAQLINSSNAEFKTWSHHKTQFNKSVKGELISSSAKSSAVKFTTSEGGYPQRRKENIDLSDITIALAKDFSTLGEKGTKKDAVAVGKYVAGNLEGSRGKKLEAKQIAEGLLKDIKKAKLPTKNVKLNIAGNGIYSLSESQEYYNDLVTDVIKELQNL